MPKPTKFHLLRDDNLATRVKHEEIKQTSKKESVFDILSFEFHTVLQMLQETDPLAQKIRTKTVIDCTLPKGMEDL